MARYAVQQGDGGAAAGVERIPPNEAERQRNAAERQSGYRVNRQKLFLEAIVPTVSFCRRLKSKEEHIREGFYSVKP
ncbi:hypothetical protein J6590_071676 [Homalodisca vitripennis]|nr:hypothetical protein J6590_071676 [Homalodisca vitripennis]